ncbi:unnamed protein product [Triticum turgidum subsp. durum]|uniref:Leucine-rich repeat-containing N-terminal plant-type domain-containing protein n=1 Tax=Triticum turgidum subsp. durum TaxID=4567 RepID=A0A9R1RRP9_TRITD|nr:unnamed protein product [Triticum turgidum subsp. durum]
MRTVPTTILLLLLLLALPPPAAVALTDDGLALLAFKAAVTDDPASVLAKWSESDADPCRWPGVTCANISSQPRVVGLAVAGKNVAGYIPSELGSLLFLRRLNLHDNRLTGGIPAALSNASSLHSIFLYNNALTGKLPMALCDLPRLQNLDVSRNSLSGELPLDLRNCRSLQRLIVSRNTFSGEVPTGVWPELSSLQQLDLSSNAFNGSIPPDLGQLPKLSGTLNLSHNQFSGIVPPELGRLPATVTLDLRFNNLSGAIPQTGSLASQGPTAFLNNPALCGFPLQVACRAVPPPTQSPPPQNTSSSTASGGSLLGGAIPYTKPPAPAHASGYRAPEARAPGARPAQKWDVFSFGVILLELLTGRGPADHASPSTSASFSGQSTTTTDRSGSAEHEAVPEVVRWVRRGFEDARPVAEMVDPALLREAPTLPKKEIVAAFHVALACTEADPELRPKMKTVADSLDKIGS